jgi:hypothetical protein
MSRWSMLTRRSCMDCRIKSGNDEMRSARHARLYAGHPRLFDRGSKTWMAGTSPAMTIAIGKESSAVRAH